MNRTRIFAIFLIIILALVGYYAYKGPAYKLGLDLNGGTELVYKADLTQIAKGDVNDSMDTLRDVIERRVNVFGVSEPLVQVEQASALSGTNDHRLIVELPGVTNIDEAVKLIGETPTLEFMLLRDNAKEILKANASSTRDELFIPTGLTGRLLDRADLEFNQTTNEPIVGLTFNSEGTDLFAKITKENKGKILAIFLDGQAISTPVIREEIPNGKAQISGSFTPEIAKVLVRNLNYGALPVPIELVGTETIGPSLGDAALHAGLRAGLWGFLLVVIFLVLWYRLPGLIASFSLVMYVALSLSLFKLIPVTLTAAGLAGFILSIGMAVDANILIFERMKEEIKRGKKLTDSMHEGFARAWLSIRDSNISSMITALVLFWVGTSAVKGFALTFGLGVLVSMFTAITVSRTLLFALGVKHESKISHFLFGSGITK